MTRRGWRGWPVPAIPAGSRRAAPPGPYHKQGQIPSVPMPAFGWVLRGLPINPNARQATLSAAGGGTVQIGPEAVGTRWYPTMVGLSTSVGPSDVATVALYVGPLALPAFQVATSYQGGGDTIGLNNAEMHRGTYIIAVWSGGTAGSVATVTVSGVMDALDY